MSRILFQGAEAIIELKNNTVLKKRISKGYRITELDSKLRKLRTRQEARLLEKAFQTIKVPRVLEINEKTQTLTLEYLKGKRLSQHLSKLPNRIELSKQIGRTLAKLHDSNIIHGDPTTSNMIYKEKQIYMIDFGLGFQSSKIEDRAVDLHLLKEALEAKHPEHFEACFKSVISGYKNSQKAQEVLNQLEKVERRGRYKAQY